MSVPRRAIAWVLHKGDEIVPLVGSRRTATLTDSLKALDIRLSAENIERLNVAYPLCVIEA